MTDNKDKDLGFVLIVLGMAVSMIVMFSMLSEEIKDIKERVDRIESSN